MSSTIGKFDVFYLDETRRKQVKFNGTLTNKDDTEIMIDHYDNAEDLMNMPTQADDGLIYEAVTPGEFIIGKIDAGDNEPWFIDQRSVEHIIGDNGNFTGCALRSQGWARDLPGDGTGNTGIVIVPVAGLGTIVEGDIGKTVTQDTDGDTGTLLDIYDDGTNRYLWIRPTDNTLANDWNSTLGTITATAGGTSGAQSAAAHTGEMVWSNVFTSGALVAKTHVYVIQNGVKLKKYNTSGVAYDEDWWTDGNFDRAIPIKDFETAAFPTIDEGYLTVHARQYATNYFPLVIRANTTSGGNISAGLTSGSDIGNTTGYASITVSGGSGNWSVGDEISGDISGARAVLTLITGSNPTPTLHYYYIGDPLTAFNGSEAITNVDDTGAATGSGAVANQGPALSTWFDNNAVPTVTFTSTQVDVDDDGTPEEYGIAWDVNQASLGELYEYMKYVQRRGSTFSLDTLDGEQWIGLALAINYSAFTVTIAEGDVATGATSGATATVVSFPGGTNDWMLLRDVRGTFTDSETINFTSGGNMSAAQVLTVEVIVPFATNSFGQLAGTNLFLTRGVVITDYRSADENLWSTIDASGATKARPTTISLNAVNLLQYDWISWFRLDGAGGDIDKPEYAGTVQSAGATTVVIGSSITADTIGKASGGRLVIRDDSDTQKQEYVLRFTSWTGSTFTLTASNIASADGATTTTINETGAFASSKVGDLVYNNGNGHDGVSYITEVTDNDNVVIFPAITGQTTGDNIDLNTLPIATTTSDDVYVPFMLDFRETAGTQSASMVYISPIESIARLRNTSGATIKIKGISAAIQITADATANLARIPNTVYGS